MRIICPLGIFPRKDKSCLKKEGEGDFYAMATESGYLMSLISLKKWKRCGGEQGVAVRLYFLTDQHLGTTPISAYL